jgi:hypothetical protein
MIYSAVADFSTTSNTHKDTWAYLYKNDAVRDGNYQRIEPLEPELRLSCAGKPIQAIPGPNPAAWQLHGGTPWVSVNAAGTDQTLHEWGRTIIWPQGTMFVHPGEGGLVVVRWTSPVDAVVDIFFAFADGYPSGRGDGIVGMLRWMARASPWLQG